jgi:hypothetical protein
LPLPRRPGRLKGKVNPAFCFQHDEDAATVTCSACRLPFCAACVVSLREQPLCGPCKNFHLAALGRPRRLFPLGVVALVVALTSGPVALLLSLVGAGLFLGDGLVSGALALCLLATALPIAGLALTGLALRRLEKRPHLGGRSLALGGACAALVGLLWSVTVAALVVAKNLVQ